MKKISLIVSVFNEEENIEILAGKISDALKNIDYEVIFVDDGSTDKTKLKIKSLNGSRITLIELKKNYGQSSALAAGIEHASGEFIVTIDGDLQNDPADIPMMIDLAEKE